MEVGSYATKSQRDIVAAVKMRLRLETTDDDLLLMDFVNEGVSRLDTLGNYTQKEGCFDVCDGKVKLPNGYHELIAFRFGTEDGTCGNGLYASLPYIKGCGCNINTVSGANVYNYKGTAVIVGDYLVFHTTPTFTKIFMSWEGLNVDEDGFFLIYDLYTICLINYARWQYAQVYPEKYGQMIDRWERDFVNQKARVRSLEQLQSFRRDKRQIAEWVNAWVGQKRFPM